MKKFIIIIFSLLAMYISSCKPEPIDLLVKQSPQRYALSSQYIGNGVLGVSVSKTFEALQTKNNGIDSTGFNFDSSLLVGNAKVIIKGNNGITKELINVEKGIYVTETAEIIDLKNYTIEVFVDNKMVMNAQTNKPIKVNFDSISTYRVSNSKVVNVYYQISDNITEENYYLVNYLIKNKQDNINQQPTPEIIAKRMLSQNITFDLLNDKDFINGKITVEKTVSDNYESDTLAVSLSNISKGYYHFLVAQKRAGTWFNQLRGEVINLPSNIINGYGYFQLSEPDLRILDIYKK